MDRVKPSEQISRSFIHSHTAQRSVVTRRSATALLGGAACLPFARASKAQTYPVSQVTLVVPFGPGTSTDTQGRLIAAHLQMALGRSVIVENRAGGGGTIGAAAVAHAKPDGGTILVTTGTTHSAVKGLIKNVPYDPLTDFTPVVRFARLPSMFVVNNDLPVKTIQEFVVYAKANAGKVNYGHGNGSGQVTGEIINQRTGIAMTRVAYKSNVQAATDVIAGHIQAMTVDLTVGLPLLAAGKFRPLAMLSPERNALLPDLPTLSETIIPGFDTSNWAGIFAPAKTPRPTVDVLAAEMKSFVARPDVREKFDASGTEVSWLDTDAFGPFLARELLRWTTMIKDAGIEPE